MTTLAWDNNLINLRDILRICTGISLRKLYRIVQEAGLKPRILFFQRLTHQ